MTDASTAGVADRTVVITGAGGSIGAGVARAILAGGPRRLVLVDSSEANLYEVDSDLSSGSGAPRHVPMLGDVGDVGFLSEMFETHRPDVVYHAAAFKHVPLMEGHPVAAAWNNALATDTLARLAVQFAVGQVVMVSTDKAVRPASVMGATKRVAEMVLLVRGDASPRTRMRVLRLGNVLESRGSVVPLFRRRIAEGAPLPVTHPDVRRFMLTLDESVDLILRAGSLEGPGGLFVPVVGPPVLIVELARDMLLAAGRPADETGIVFTGLRPGDKMSEELHAPAETAVATKDPRLMRIEGPKPDSGILGQGMAALARAVGRRDAAAVVETLQDLVAGYYPSAAVLETIGRPIAESR
jgi:FlaA1/EpsC-like NDP-sugar epimerase